MSSIILLHGALGASIELEAIKELLENDFHVHTIEFNGHGSNANQGDFTIQGFQKDLSKYIEENDLNDAFVFGYSMGGYVTLYHESLNPGSFRGIITLGTKFDWNPETSNKEAGYLVPDKLKEKLPHYVDYLSSIHSIGWEENMVKTRELMLSLGNDTVLQDNKLSTINIPVVIARGELDKMVSKEESERIATIIPTALYREIKNMKHPLNQIDPEILVTFIKNTMKDVL